MLNRASVPSVAIVGAGMAGLSCAHHLLDAGYRPHVFEALSLPGGRVSSDQAGRQFYDDGAQFLTVRTPALQAQLDQWLASGVAAPWTPRMQSLPQDTWYVGVPHMRALAESLANSVVIQYESPIAALVAQGPQWRLNTATSLIDGLFDAVVVATTSQQAAQLLQAHMPAWSAVLNEVTLLPCWTIVVSTDTLSLPWDAQHCPEGPVSWWARDDSKPGRLSEVARDRWVIQANAQWSLQHRNATSHQVTQSLLTHFNQTVCGSIPLSGVQVHSVRLWHAARRSHQQAPVGDSLWCAQRRLGVCGDGLSHSRVEQAYLSGHQLAGQLLDFLHTTQQEVL